MLNNNTIMEIFADNTNMNRTIKSLNLSKLIVIKVNTPIHEILQKMKKEYGYKVLI